METKLDNIKEQFEHYEALLRFMNWEYEQLYPEDKDQWLRWKEIDLELRELRADLYGLDPEDPTKSVALYAKYSGGEV
jgi:hypothetical protein